MDKLPAELIHAIASHLTPPLAGYATISSTWQHAIESRTFASVTAYSGVVLFGQFKAVFAAVRRRTLLRNLAFYARLPLRDEDGIIEEPLTRQEVAEDDVAYTHALVALFSFLSTWKYEGHARLTIALRAVTPLPVDDGFGCDFPNYTPELSVAMKSLPAVGFSRNALEKSGGLPTVPVVCSFTAGCFGRHLDPAAIPLVARALPNIGTMRYAYHPSTRRLPDLRRTERLALANALSSIARADLRLLTMLTIYCVDEDPFNEAFNPPSLIGPTPSRDHLSVAFRHISQLPCLRHLCLRGYHVVGSELFEDPGSPVGDSAPTWPALVQLELSISVITPDGRWYFSGDESNAYYDDDYDSNPYEVAAWEDVLGEDDSREPRYRFRSTPDSATFTPFIMSLVCAVARMPVLRKLEFEAPWDCSRPGIRVYYFGAGERRGCDTLSLAEQAFHAARLEKSRWVLTLRNYPEAQWLIPPELRAALTRSTGEGCVLVTGGAEVVF